MKQSRNELEQKAFDIAKDQWHQDGEIEIDDDAVVSLSEDQDGIRGAYVQGWLWIDLEPEEEE